jgi:D-amino-acid dehydrogenase
MIHHAEGAGMRHVDVIVLGAGMVGIGAALHLLERGRSVALVDRRAPAEETSYGNAGLIQSEAVVPYAFPRSLPIVLGVLAGRRTDARVDYRALHATAPWLLAFARHSSAEAVARTARANLPLVRSAVPEHRRLMERAGALHLVRGSGYLRVYDTPEALESAAKADALVRETYGVPFEVWDRERLRAEEPHLAEGLAGAVHLPEPLRTDDPADLGKAYAALFEREGGTIVRGDAATLRGKAGRWTVSCADGGLSARDVVIALGPWSADLMKALGRQVPLGVKRGYHQHYRPQGNAVLNRLVVDPARGFVLAPNRRGIRLTTGAEFARRDDPPTPVQLRRDEPLARALFPLGEALSDTPWMGARPCLPDLLPMIGPVPGQPGLWADFGHHHLGFTLGPATGRLLAEMITGEEPFADPFPYRVDRFG